MKTRNMRAWIVAVGTAAAVVSLSACGQKESEANLLASAQRSIDSKDVRTAIIQLKTALQQNPQSGRARFLLGQTLLAQGDAAGAVLELNKAREQRYDENVLLPVLARALLNNGQAKKVTEDFGTVALTDAKAASALQTTVAAAYVVQGLNDRAQSTVAGALQSDPRNVPAQLLQARLTAGRGAGREAMAAVDAVLAADPKVAEAWVLKAELLWVVGQDPEAAMKAFREALAVEPTLLRAHTGLLQLQLLKNDVAGFKSQVAELNKARPGTFEATFYQAQLALANGELAKAQESAQQLLRLAPDQAAVLQLAGTVELQNGAAGVAQTHLAQAVQFAPDVPAARRLLAEAYLRSGQSAKALQTLGPLLGGDTVSADVLRMAADAHLQEGDLARAEALYTRATKEDPTDARARVSLALAQVARGQGDAGVAQLEAIAGSDKSSYADLALVTVLVQRGQLDAAGKAIDRLQGKVPDKPLPYLMRGRLLMLQKNLSEARVSLDKALSLDPSYFAALTELTSIDLIENKAPAAQKRWEAVVAREPRNMGATLALAELRRRMGAPPEELETLLTTAVKANPADPLPRLALVQFNLDARRAKAALAVAQDGLSVMPDEPQLLEALGRAQLAAGETQQALNTFKKIAGGQSSSPDPHLRLAEIYINMRDYDAATQSLQRALDIAPKLVAAQRGLVQVALARKQVPAALQVARDVQKQRPNEAVGFLMEGEIASDQSNWAQAAPAFRQALERERSSEIAMRLHASLRLDGRTAEADKFAAGWEKERPRDIAFLFYLGNVALERKDDATAEARYRQVLTITPDNAASLNNVAATMARQGKPGAMAFAEKANQLMPEQAFIMDTMASVLAADKQTQKAIEWQQKAVSKEPGTPDYRLNLAKLLIAAGEPAKARAELEKLVALGGRYADQATVAQLLKSL